MNIFVGIDDTDNKESRGTGFKAREMARLIEERNLGIVNGISRHQLYIHPDIPYTSQNSSACLEVDCNSITDIKIFCEQYLLEVSAPGSDAGLCIIESNKIINPIIEWGLRAKKEVLSKDEAEKFAEKKDVFLKGLTGTKDGIIGSLAAVGLKASCNDGRYIWLKGKKNLRELEGIYLIRQLKAETQINTIVTKDGTEVPDSDKLFVGDWVRPLLKDNKILLIVEEEINNETFKWKIASKLFIKHIS